MSANVETAVYANTPAWHREGTVLDTGDRKGITLDEAYKESGLNWEVEKVDIFGPQNQKIEGRYGVQRSTDKSILGVVGSSWQPVQNSEGFAVIEDILQTSDAHIEAAGSLDGGRKVWVLAHMDEQIQIAGDDVDQFLLFTNGHDGRTAVTAANTNVRVVCQNTLALSLGTAKRIVRVRHTNKATDRLAEAKQILGARDLYAEELAKQGEWLVENEMSDGEFEQFLSALVPIREDQAGTPADTMMSDKRDELTKLFTEAVNLKPVRNTRWAALNAVVEYADYGRNFKTDESQLKAQWAPQPIKDEALLLLSKPQKEIAKIGKELALAK